MKVAILSSPNQWFIPHARTLQDEIRAKFKHKISLCELFFESVNLQGFDLVFVLSFHKILSPNELSKNKLTLVLHASNLPAGKGWSPLFWQVLEGKNEIIFTLFRADERADNGEIYLQKSLNLSGLELYDELRTKQAELTRQMCLEFIALYPHIKARKQSGHESFYHKRTPKDSELDINKSISEQFNLLRICSNDEFPAFFYKDGKKFVLKIYDENV